MTAPESVPSGAEWFSDEALRKQAEVDRLLAAGEQPPLVLLLGLMEPRTLPVAHERCTHCGMDARDPAGGRVSKGVRWCSLCLDRERRL